MRKLRVVLLISALALILIFLFRVVPFGTGSSFPFEMNGSASISIARPRYIIPREIWMTGWPLPGGDAGFYADPHYSATGPGEGEIRVNGSYVVVKFQGFMINPRFTNAAYKDSILSYELFGQRFEARTLGVDYTAIPSPTAIVLIGEVNENLSFLLAESPPRIILAPKSGSSLVANAKIVTQADAEWVPTMKTLRKNVKQEEFARFCNSATKPIIAFWKEELMLSCPEP